MGKLGYQFIHLSHEILNHPGLRPVDLALLCRILQFGNPSYPSLKTLSQLMHVDKRTVMRSIKKLELMGILKVERGGNHIEHGKSNTYFVNQKLSTRVTPQHQQGCQENTTKGDKRDTRRVTPQHQELDSMNKIGEEGLSDDDWEEEPRSKESIEAFEKLKAMGLFGGTLLKGMTRG